MHRKINSSRDAFTIVELLIVIVVIGILAAITIVSFNGVQNKARVAAAQSSLNAATKQVEIAKTIAGNTTYPATVSGLDANLVYTANASLGGYCIVNTTIAGTPYLVTSSNTTAHTGPTSVATGCDITNLVTNPSFENSNYNWTTGQRASVNYSSTYGGAPGAGSSAGILTRTSATAGEGYIGTHIATTVGKYYSISFFVRRVSGTAPVNLGVVNYNQGFSLPDPTNGATTVTLSTTFTRYTLTWKAQDTDSYFLMEDTGTVNGTQIAIDGVIATEGDNTAQYVDPTTRSDWTWNGSAGYSTSHGPAF